MKLKTKPHLAELDGEGPHLLVVHPGGVPVEGGREVVGQHLPGKARWMASAKRLASCRSAVLVSIQRMSAKGAAASDLAMA